MACMITKSFRLEIRGSYSPTPCWKPAHVGSNYIAQRSGSTPGCTVWLCGSLSNHLHKASPACMIARGYSFSDTRMFSCFLVKFHFPGEVVLQPSRWLQPCPLVYLLFLPELVSSINSINKHSFITLIKMKNLTEPRRDTIIFHKIKSIDLQHPTNQLGLSNNLAV